ncbi:hypothetical protein F5Y03DRAFT_376095 [Xylaria venustula]|nr:hypothetical protein F5Y03DRAFT_376095 [Xylaria venustula]
MMPSAKDIASKLAYVNGMLIAGGTNKQMREWWTEYKKLSEELKETKAAGVSTPDPTAEKTVKTTAPDTVETKTSQKKHRKITFKEPTDDGSLGKC